MENIEIVKKTKESEAGFFNLKEFVGYPIRVVQDYFTKKGWIYVSCFNDYKYAWVHLELNLSIIAKVDIIDNPELDNEVIYNIWSQEGIYHEYDKQ